MRDFSKASEELEKRISIKTEEKNPTTRIISSFTEFKRVPTIEVEIPHQLLILAVDPK